MKVLKTTYSPQYEIHLSSSYSYNHLARATRTGLHISTESHRLITALSYTSSQGTTNDLTPALTLILSREVAEEMDVIDVTSAQLWMRLDFRLITEINRFIISRY